MSNRAFIKDGSIPSRCSFQIQPFCSNGRFAYRTVEIARKITSCMEILWEKVIKIRISWKLWSRNWSLLGLNIFHVGPHLQRNGYAVHFDIITRCSATWSNARQPNLNNHTGHESNLRAADDESEHWAPSNRFFYRADWMKIYKLLQWARAGKMEPKWVWHLTLSIWCSRRLCDLPRRDWLRGCIPSSSRSNEEAGTRWVKGLRHSHAGVSRPFLNDATRNFLRQCYGYALLSRRLRLGSQPLILCRQATNSPRSLPSLIAVVGCLSSILPACQACSVRHGGNACCWADLALQLLGGFAEGRLQMFIRGLSETELIPYYIGYF